MKRSPFMAFALALGISALIGMSGQAMAYPGSHGGGNPSVSQEQREAAQEIFAEHAKAVAPLHRQLQAKRAELNALSYADKPDQSKVQALFREIADIRAKLFSANADLRGKLEAKGIAGPGYGPCMGPEGSGMQRGHRGHGCPGGGHPEYHQGYGNQGGYGGHGGRW